MAFVITPQQGYPVKSSTLGSTSVNAAASPSSAPATSQATATSPAVAVNAASTAQSGPASVRATAAGAITGFVITSEQGYPVKSATLTTTGINATSLAVSAPATSQATASVAGSDIALQGFPAVADASAGAANATSLAASAPATSQATASVPVSAPVQVTGLAVALLQVPLSWSVVSGATSYRLYRNGSLIASPSSTSATDALASGTSAIYTVSAVDSFGTEGPQSTGVVAGGSGLRTRIN